MSVRLAAAASACALLLAPLAAGAVTLDFETEDDFTTPLVNGQIVDPAFDGADLEFGNLVDVSSVQLGSDGHNGVTVFDTTPCPGGPNCGSQDPDLLVDLGNILLLQSDNPASANDTTLDATYGLLYDNPNDEADFSDRGSIVFDFLSPQTLLSIAIIDANGGFLGKAILTDGSANTRTYTVPAMWTGDIDTCGSCAGWDTLDFTTLAGQLGEGGSTATAVEDAGFDPTDVTKLEFQFLGNPSSGGLDNLTFIPEPAAALLLASGLVALAMGRRRGTR